MLQDYPPVLTNVQQRIVNDFRRDGVSISHVDELFPGQHLLAKLQSYADELSSQAEIKSGKIFLRYLFDAVPRMDLANPFVRVALDDTILNIIGSYLDVAPKFYFFTLNITVPMQEGQKPMQSQRWHRDSEDKRIPKMFIYLNDVDETAGPFTGVKRSHYGGKWRRLFGQRPPHGSRAPYGKVEEIVPQSDIKTCTGRAGTVVFYDTSGLHKGGYATKKQRIMFTAVYASPASYKYMNHRGFVVPDDFSSQLAASSLSALGRFALTRVVPSRLFRFIHHRKKQVIEQDY